MLFFYGFCSDRPFREILREFEKERPGFAVLLKPEFAAFAPLVTYSILLSFKAFQEGRNKAGTPELEAMRFLSCRSNVSAAAEFCKPAGSEMLAVSTVPIDGVLERNGKTKPLGAKLKAGKKDATWLAGQYGISAGGKTPEEVAQLVREKIVVFSLD